MKRLSLLLILVASGPLVAHASCESTFDQLIELRISTYDLATRANTLPECLKIIENFNVDTADAPEHCNGSHASENWASSYESDTGKALSKNQKEAYLELKNQGYSVLKKKCSTRNYN